SRCATALTQSRPSPRTATAPGSSGQAVLMRYCLRNDATLWYVQALPVLVQWPSACKRAAIAGSGSDCASCRTVSTTAGSVVQCHPIGGQVTVWLVVAPPLQRMRSAAARGLVVRVTV